MFLFSSRRVFSSLAARGPPSPFPLTAPFIYEMDFNTGDLVEYKDFHDKYYIGIVAKPFFKKDSETVKDLMLYRKTGDGALQSPRFLLYFSPAVCESSEYGFVSKESAKIALTTFENEAKQSLRDNFKKFEEATDEQMKESVNNDGHGYQNLIYEADIAKRVFGSSPKRTDLYAIHLYLYSFNRKFARDFNYQPWHGENGKNPLTANTIGSGPYFMRPDSEIALLNRVENLISSRSNLLESFRGECLQIFTGEGPEYAHNWREYSDFVSVLKMAATTNWQDFHGSPFVRVAKEILSSITHIDSPEDLSLVFKKLGLNETTRDLDVPLLQSGLRFHSTSPIRPPTAHDEDGLSSVLDGRVQFDEITLAIDSSSTIDVDDAMSIQQDGQDYWLHIHIADPAAFVTENSPIDLLSRSRATSVYLPLGAQFMLPGEVTRKASLTPGRKYNLTLTFSARLQSNGDISDFQVNRSFLTNLQRITYEEADEIILADSTKDPRTKMLNILLKAQEMHRTFRFAQGTSVELNLPKGQITCNRSEGDGQVHIKFGLENNPGRESCFSKHIVSEMMVLAGRVAASFCVDNNIPAPFRYHVDPELEHGYLFKDLCQKIKQAGVSATTYDKLKLLKYLQASAVDVHPRPHWGMSLKHYTKATSPIRRYFDLLLHQQLHSHFNGMRVRSISDISTILPPVYRHEQYTKRLERQSVRYWTFRYLENIFRQMPPGAWEPIQVTAIPMERTGYNKLRVYIEEFAIFQFASIPGSSKLEIGVPVRMFINSVDAMRQAMSMSIC